MILHCGKYRLVLDRPLIMGVVNVTPDSFSDGGAFVAPRDAIARVEQVVGEGAAIVDIGGESTRPGAAPVSVAEEIDRVMPAIERALATPAIVSIDTSRPEVIRAATRAGVHFVNDVRALTVPGALEAAAASDAAVCVTHMQGNPADMQDNPRYDDVVREVAAYLEARVAACTGAGIGRGRIVIDPGFGFGKTRAHNLALLRRLGVLVASGLPVLAGLSRKRLIGEVTGRPVGERLAGSIALATIAALNGACIVRAHDVAATVDALRLVAALREDHA